MRPRTLQDIAAAGIAVTCVSSFSDAAPAFKPLPPGAQPSGAIVSLQLSGAAPAVGTALLLAQLLAAAPAGVAFAMITVDGGRNNWVSRAALVRPAGWPSPGQKQIFVQQTSEFLDAFNKIYSQKLWSAAGGGSGVGSTHAYTGAQPAPHGTYGAAGARATCLHACNRSAVGCCRPCTHLPPRMQPRMQPHVRIQQPLSPLPLPAAEVRKLLPDIIKRYNVSSMLDSSCGRCAPRGHQLSLCV